MVSQPRSMTCAPASRQTSRGIRVSGTPRFPHRRLTNIVKASAMAMSRQCVPAHHHLHLRSNLLAVLACDRVPANTRFPYRAALALYSCITHPGGSVSSRKPSFTPSDGAHLSSQLIPPRPLYVSLVA